MKILYFSQTYTTHDWRFLDKLSKTRHEVWFLPLEQSAFQREKRPLPEGIHPIYWSKRQKTKTGLMHLVRLLPDLVQIVRRIQPDLIHAGPIQSCGFLAALTRFHPLMLMSWGSDILVDADRNGVMRKITGFALKRSDMIVCDCAVVQHKIQQAFGYPENRMLSFPWGVDLDRFKPSPASLDVRQQLGWLKNPVLLSTRSWEPIYGIDILLDAFGELLRHLPETRLILMGTGSLAGQIQSRIQTEGLADKIHLPGQVAHDRLPEYFNLADLYVSTSLSDGSSISLLEAMACGLPVVVSDIPGNREWVQPGQHGWLFQSGSAPSLANALTRALAETSTWDAFKQNNRLLAQQKANWHLNFQQLLTGYDRLIAA